MRCSSNIVIALLLSAGLFGCQKQSAPPPKAAKAPADKQWTPEEMAKDPEGYLRWADAKVEAQIAQCETRQKALKDTLDHVSARRKDLDENIAEVQNIHDRMERAIRSSDDEGRLPIQMGGQTFSREDAERVMTKSLQWIQQQQPLAQEYADAVGKFETAVADMSSQVAEMRRTREQLALRIDEVRLNQGSAELEGLKKTEADIGGFAKAITKNDEIIDISNLAKHEEKRPDKVDIDTFLKK